MDPTAHDGNDLAAFVEGRLTGGARDRFVAHLAECRECRATVAAYTKAGRGDTAAPRAPIGMRRPRVWMPIAASVALAAGAALVALRLTGGADVPVGSTATKTPEPAERPRAVTPPNQAPTPPPQAPAPAKRDTPAATPGRADDSLLRLRSGTRVVGGKTFQLVAGEWIDRAYDPAAGLPVVQARTDTERADLLQRMPALRAYARLGDRVVVVHDGRVYRFDKP